MIDEMQLDSEIRQVQSSIKYDLRVWTIRVIVERFRDGEFYIPPYQRNFVWNINSQSNFIESMIIGLPTASLFVAETEDGREEVVDGYQRIKTLEQYVNGDLQLKNLTTIAALNGTNFDDLPHLQKRKFLNRSLAFTSLSHDTNYDARLEIFTRMNVGGVARNHNEMRSAILFDDEIRGFVEEAASIPLFLTSANINSFQRVRGEANEMVVRFFALSDRLEYYRGDMNKFLDGYIGVLAEQLDRERRIRELREACIFVDRYLKEVFHSKKYRPTKTLFDAIYVGTNLALRENRNLEPKSVSWLFTEEFRELVAIHAAQTQRRIKDRIFFVRDHLLKGA